MTREGLLIVAYALLVIGSVLVIGGMLWAERNDPKDQGSVTGRGWR